MSYPRRLSCTILALLLVAAATSRLAAADAIDVDDLRPGLVATYRDGAKAEIVRLEPAVAISWKAGETAHPRLGPDGDTVDWTGYLNILNAGPYRFSGVVRGKLQVRIDGKEVLTADVNGDTPTLHTGPETRLEGGPHAITVKFTRHPGAARVELFWKAPRQANEPVPHEALFHLPKKVPAKLAADHLVERGRFLAEEHNCTACHKAEGTDKLGKGLLGRQGPDLSAVGFRARSGWLFYWLNDPQKVRLGAIMPRLFTDDDNGRVEAYAVARYLASLEPPAKEKPKPPPLPNPKEVVTSIRNGERLFTSVGCVACHREEKPGEAKAAEGAIYSLARARRNFPLGNLGNKTTPEKLAAYLLNPHAVDPSGRMPNMVLEQKEAVDLARFLCRGPDKDIPPELPEAPAAEARLAAFQRLEAGADAVAEFKKLAAEKQLLDLGQRLVSVKGCVGCHTVKPGGKALPEMPSKVSFTAIKPEKTHGTGCLADDAGKRGKAPLHHLNDAERKALSAFLKEGATGPGSPAPAHAARVALQRFNCLACHSRDGEGGLSPDLIDQLRKHEKAENAEAVSPPPLTGVGHKLRTPWLKQVLTQKGRARPWMALRMPQFGEANVGMLPDGFAALEGTEPDDKVHKVPLNAAKIEAGKKMVGKGGFGCISCHDLAGIPNTGTRGPDLAGMNQRVRYDWYHRWLAEAGRMQPGTRMPIIFPDGKSTLDRVLEGKPDAQAEAIWAYLSLGPGLPLPEGMEPLKGLVLTVKDRPVVLRTFMPEAGSRAVAVGFPSGVAAAFDAHTCRLAYAWSGNFLDASPVWANRGGSPAKVLGPKFWTAPPGCPWGIRNSNEPPDFAAQTKDPAYGGPVPEGKLYTGPQQLAFEGYSLDKDGVPTFRYRLDANEPQPVEIKERLEPVRSSVALGVGRRFVLSVPAEKMAWLLAGEGQQPRVLDGKANAVEVDLKGGRVELPSADRLIVLPQGGEKIIVLQTTTEPEGTRWVLQKRDGKWQALLKLPAPAKASELKLGVNVWAPFRDEPALLKELVSTK